MIEERISTKSKNKKWKILMNLHSDTINKDFNEKVEEVDIVEEYVEEILRKLVLNINDTSDK